MTNLKLRHDPYNLIITGVGGQGNVLASRMLGNILGRQGLWVTIGETFGASQRGGSVMSHLRVSAQGSWSPQIPAGRAHLVLALEPMEALRVLIDYGNPQAKAIVNDRPIMPVAAITGSVVYPSQEEMAGWLGQLTSQYWMIPATQQALKLGNSILANGIMVGALAASGELPLSREDFAAEITGRLGEAKAAPNLEAFDLGAGMVKS